MTPGEALDQRIGAIEKRLQTVHDRVSALEARGRQELANCSFVDPSKPMIHAWEVDRWRLIERAAMDVVAAEDEWERSRPDNHYESPLVRALRSALDGEGE